MSTGGQGARVRLPDAGAESSRALATYLAGCDVIVPFRRRADGVARRDFVADEQRTEAARRLAADTAASLRDGDDATDRAVTAQALLDAIDARIRYERGNRNLALWVLLEDHERQVTATGAYRGTGWTPQDATRLVCVSRALWENSVRNHRPDPWPAMTEREAEESGAKAGRNVRDLGALRAAVLPVRDTAVRALAGSMKNVEIAEMLGITPERVAQVRTGSG